MAYLQIGDKEYQARTDFKFSRTANEKYDREEDGKKLGGLNSVYMGLMSKDTEYLAAFWDCALSHLKGGKPSLENIEDALYERIEAEGDAEPVIKEAFQVIENSGFFKSQIREIWKNTEAFSKTGKTAEEKKENKEAAQMMKKSRAELLA